MFINATEMCIKLLTLTLLICKQSSVLRIVGKTINDISFQIYLMQKKKEYAILKKIDRHIVLDKS